MNTKPWYQRLLGSSWATTLVGILGAGIYALTTALTTGMTPKDAVNAAVIAALGMLAKQFNKSNAPDAMPDAKSTPTPDSKV